MRYCPAGAGFRQGQGFSKGSQLSDHDGFDFLVLKAVNMGPEFFLNQRLTFRHQFFSQLTPGGQTHVHSAGPGAIADFQSLLDPGLEPGFQRLLHPGFTQAARPQGPADKGTGDKLLPDQRGDKRLKHRTQFPGRAWQQD